MYQHSAQSVPPHLRLAVVSCFLIVISFLLLPVLALAGGIELDSREYKLMLNPEKFTGQPQQAVERFIKEQLGPAVREQWNSDAAAELAKKGLELGERRIIQFWDSGDCLLCGTGLPGGRGRISTSRAIEPTRWS